ncbi:hypothetical protein MUK42_09572 [Musa troglodytarum]|uniref:Uncharacterized protein n=1 Tax=Musa troglodytarum TaxID=320322 RepID=A0A9E7EBY7_9LILI|nr:hypothetical protein MUK42_09572 [Musa troglodytarum]
MGAINAPFCSNSAAFLGFLLLCLSPFLISISSFCEAESPILILWIPPDPDRVIVDSFPFLDPCD